YMIPKPFPQDVALGRLIADTQDLYRIDEIVGTFVEIFLFHKESWVHLITFKDRPVEGVDAFRHELSQYTYETQLPQSLFRVTIRMNPAGYIFLKNVLVHFE